MVGLARGGTRFLGLDEREQKLSGARFARGGAIDELRDRRLKFRDTFAFSIHCDRDPLPESGRDDGGETARALWPSTWITRDPRAKARGDRRATIADRIFPRRRGAVGDTLKLGGIFGV